MSSAGLTNRISHNVERDVLKLVFIPQIQPTTRPNTAHGVLATFPERGPGFWSFFPPHGSLSQNFRTILHSSKRVIPCSRSRRMCLFALVGDLLAFSVRTPCSQALCRVRTWLRRPPRVRCERSVCNVAGNQRIRGYQRGTTASRGLPCHASPRRLSPQFPHG